ARRPLPAPAAARFLPPWPHVEDDPFGADLSRLHHDPGDSQKSFEYLGDAHGALPARLSAWSPTEEHGFRAFLYASPWSIDRSPCMRAAGHHEVRRSCRPHCGRRSGSAPLRGYSPATLQTPSTLWAAAPSRVLGTLPFHAFPIRF